MSDCEHKWIFLRSEYTCTEGSYNHTWKAIDVYFCERCLEYRQTAERKEHSRNAPSWWRQS